MSDILKGRYDTLDPDCVALLKNSIERMPWRLYIHQPYEVRLVVFGTTAKGTDSSASQHWVKGKACILGDGGHPSMPHQSVSSLSRRSSRR